MKTKLSPKQAIDAFCVLCIYDPYGGNGTKHEQIENCTATSCPLYEHRSLTGKTKDAIKQEEFDKLSPEDQKEYLRVKEIKANAFKERIHKQT